jgi:hypothetical protein
MQQVRSVPVRLAAVVGGYVGALSHFINHYRELGIGSFHIVLHAKSDSDPVLHQGQQLLSSLGLKPERVVIGPWHGSLNSEILSEIRRQRPQEWFVLADQDEFQLYSRPLSELIAICEEHSWELVEGCFLDRFSADGSLIEIQTATSIWEQFPVAGFFSYPILGAYPKKVVLVRGITQVGPGQHTASSSNKCPRIVEFAQIHHFKWVRQLPQYLAARTLDFETGVSKIIGHHIVTEAKRFLTYLDSNQGKIDLSTHNCMFASVGCSYTDYPQWEAVRDYIEQGRHLSSPLESLISLVQR